jgi:hypothetical protein
VLLVLEHVVCKTKPLSVKKTARGCKSLYILHVQKGPFFFQENLIDPVSADGDKTRGKYGLYKLLLILSGKDPGLLLNIPAIRRQL